MPCKSPRFVVSPLTAPVEHDRRRCTGRNTIISAVNKFLDGMLLSISLSTKSSCLQISRYCFLAAFQVYATLSPSYSRERPAIFADRPHEGTRMCTCIYIHMCACAHLRSITIFQRLLRAPVDRRLFYRVPLHSPRFDRGFINFLPNQTSDENRFVYTPRAKE